MIKDHSVHENCLKVRPALPRVSLQKLGISPTPSLGQCGEPWTNGRYVRRNNVSGFLSKLETYPHILLHEVYFASAFHNREKSEDDLHKVNILPQLSKLFYFEFKTDMLLEQKKLSLRKSKC